MKSAAQQGANVEHQACLFEACLFVAYVQLYMYAGASILWGNEAEIFIVAILWKKMFWPF